MDAHSSYADDTAAGQAVDGAVARIRDDLDRGAPWDACDAFREDIVAYPGDGKLLYWGALAHARAGATRTAHAALDAAEAATADAPLLSEILSLRGRLWKDAFHRGPVRADAMQIVGRARDQYLKAYALRRDPYPGINAATLSMLLGDRNAAQRLAREVVGSLDPQAASRAPWDCATKGEAQLLLGDFDGAASIYAEAYRRGNAGDVATMRRQLSLLARVIPEASDMLRLLPSADVVAFAGHMIDAPGRPTPRFPAALVPGVTAALREYVASLREPIVFTSAACGADLLFIEAALERDAEVNVVLPFDREEFVRTSVAFAGDQWQTRFDAALARATRVIMATEESYLGDDVLFEHAAVLVEGLSMLRAAQLQTTPSLVCLLDGGDAARVGGTRTSVVRWTRNVAPPTIIDLRALRESSGIGATPPRRASGNVAAPARPASDVPSTAPAGQRPARTLKTMLFADFAGYSRLHDAFAPLFQQRFLEIGAALINASIGKPLEANTWGDALYAVFESPQEGAQFALSLLERMLEVDWVAAGLSESSQIRIALHTGPVFCGFDPITRRDGHFGSSVTRAARIEPVTPPGMVYASEAFAAALAATGQRDVALEYIGKLPLAKSYGESRIYRLDRV